MPGVLGVDVSLGRGFDAALVQDAAVKETWSRVGPSRLKDLLRAVRPAAVAIDAPPKPGLGLLRDEAERAKLAVPPRPGTHLSRRVAEYELARRGIGSHQTHYDESRLFSWMTAGFEAYQGAEAAGYRPYFGERSTYQRAFEAFPYASYVALAWCLSPGRKWRVVWRRSVLVAAGVRSVPEEATIDVLDAICAAFTAERYVLGHGSFIGDPREGVIVLPVKRLADEYHRCPPPGRSGLDGRPKAARLCECGCGAPVRRRFLRGHHAKLRSRLLREARVGTAARDEPARRGWTRLVKEG